MAFRTAVKSFGEQVNEGKFVATDIESKIGSQSARRHGFSSQQTGAYFPFREFEDETVHTEGKFKHPMEDVFFRTESGNIYKIAFDQSEGKVRITNSGEGKAYEADLTNIIDGKLEVGKALSIPGLGNTTKVTEIVTTYGKYYEVGKDKAYGDENSIEKEFSMKLRSAVEKNKSHLESATSIKSFGAQVNEGKFEATDIESGVGAKSARRHGYATKQAGAYFPFREFEDETVNTESRFKHPMEEVFFRTESGNIYKIAFDYSDRKVNITNAAGGKAYAVDLDTVIDSKLEVGKPLVLSGWDNTTKVTEIVTTYGKYYDIGRDRAYGDENTIERDFTLKLRSAVTKNKSSP